MMAVMHLYFKFTQPLFIQALMGFKGLYNAKLVSIHILGKPATGDLKRHSGHMEKHMIPFETVWSHSESLLTSHLAMY